MDTLKTKIHSTGCPTIVCKAKISKSFFMTNYFNQILYIGDIMGKFKKTDKNINLNHFNPHFRIPTLL